MRRKGVAPIIVGVVLKLGSNRNNARLRRIRHFVS